MTSAAAARQSEVQLTPVEAAHVVVKPANVRLEPSVGSNTVTTLKVGIEVYVPGKTIDGQWLKVEKGGNAIGYAYAALLEDKESYEKRIAALMPPEKLITDPFAAVDFGNYYALVIGNNAYRNMPNLETAIHDAKVVAEILELDYDFHVVLLQNATRADIILALDDFRKKLTRNDNILIYYAGHGILDVASGRGYWLPVEASLDTIVSWVFNATITDSLKAMDAKHVMLVVDSCYSGTLTRDVKSRLRGPEYAKRMANKRARVVLTSGGLEPVADGGGGNHSVFAKAFITALRKNDGLMDGTDLFVQVRRPVVLNAPQIPEYSDIRFAGHDGGDFLFVKRHPSNQKRRDLGARSTSSISRSPRARSSA